ncbi:probable protein phosphatase 2C 4 [Magnolia sinica]|uniref:probable protein phosphatase 2C 4 n=1 Tax=Magnolia sinica TaxID=86752 RepID=UPI00265B4C62|nr:probable protein phosphatase 2C 4 [Magnolia sinica]
MGNGIGKLGICFSGSSGIHRRHDIAVVISEPLDEGLGHSFCYVRPDPSRLSSSKVHSEESTGATTTFRTISGASIGANASTPLSTALIDLYSYNSIDRASAAFDCSNSFASIPLQPVPRLNSGPLSGTLGGMNPSGPIERGFMSGPIERGFMSGPLDRGLFSGPLDKGPDHFQRSFSHGGYAFRPRSKKGSLIRVLKKAIARTIGQNSIIAPVKGGLSVKELDWSEKNGENITISSNNLSSDLSMEDDSSESQNLQWAQGKAGEDRVHVVVSEEHGWVFVGIYDGFNGPDAPDYLLSNLYSAVHKELKGLLWEDKFESVVGAAQDSDSGVSVQTQESGRRKSMSQTVESCSQCVETENYPFGVDSNSNRKKTRSKSSKNRFKGVTKKWEENQKRWKCEWEKERLELERRLKEQLSRSGSDRVVNHSDVLKALSQALKKTEESYLDIADKMVAENPELALMGSCVLVMLMKGEDVYLMNVGDSRAILAKKADPNVWDSLGKAHQDLERINEETLHDLEVFDGDQLDEFSNLTALQLTLDHSTCIDEEVQRIRNEHPDDASAVTNDRVKGSLKVTRAFGAGFLKQPKWNNALLEMFRIDYVGTSPYITCSPSLYHHKLGPKDRFLILSSDGLYQYLTNEEAVAQVELFINESPEGDPAQHLVEEVLFRAAKKAGMDFHELLEIPHGDRRRYHDDVSIIVISLEGRIWRSCV